MNFKAGNTVIRFGCSLKIVYADEKSVLLESTDSNNSRIDIPMEQYRKELLYGEILMQGTVSPGSKQFSYSQAQRERIEFRKPYAEVFKAWTIKRDQCKEIISRIYRENRHDVRFPNKNQPSRASCYRWAKLLADNLGDHGALKNG